MGKMEKKMIVIHSEDGENDELKVYRDQYNNIHFQICDYSGHGLDIDIPKDKIQEIIKFCDTNHKDKETK